MKPRKVEIKRVEEVLNEKGVDGTIVQDVISNLSHAEPEDDAPSEHSKKQFVMVVSDPNGELPQTDFVGWIVQIGEDEACCTVMDKIHSAGYEYNTSRKGRKMPVSSIGEIMECVGAKYLKQAGVWVKTKEPVLIIKTDNKLPTIVEE
jgi:hypothetical protein